MIVVGIVAGLVLVLLFGLASVNLLGEMAVFEDVDLGCGDAAAIDLFDLQRCADVECGGGLLEDFEWDAGVDERAEEHVACDSGEAVDKCDAHQEVSLGGGDGGHGEDVIHGAGTVALGVECDVGEAERAQGFGDAVEHFKRESAGQVGSGDFDAGQFAMVTHADLGEAEGVEGFFGALDLTEIVGSYGTAVFDARGEAGAGGLVCYGEARFSGEGADFLLGQAGGD